MLYHRLYTVFLLPHTNRILPMVPATFAFPKLPSIRVNRKSIHTVPLFTSVGTAPRNKDLVRTYLGPSKWFEKSSPGDGLMLICNRLNLLLWLHASPDKHSRLVQLIHVGGTVESFDREHEYLSKRRRRLHRAAFSKHLDRPYVIPYALTRSSFPWNAGERARLHQRKLTRLFPAVRMSKGREASYARLADTRMQLDSKRRPCNHVTRNGPVVSQPSLDTALTKATLSNSIGRLHPLLRNSGEGHGRSSY